MDSVKAELAKLRLTMQQANERVEILDKQIGDTDRRINNDQIFFNKDLNHVDLIDRAEEYLHWGRLKSQTLDTGNGLFADSCWIMCLDIYICGLKNERVTVSAIAHSSGIPMTTAMRYINVMAEQGLIEKTPNPADNRMIFVSASLDCRKKIENLLSSAPL
jgi:predicted transcriptional regulator